VENLLLIERAQLRLAPGLNVLTGETGAGKTVLAHALDLLLGGRARAGIVRPGASEAYVEGVFTLPEPLAEALAERLGADDAELVLARRVGADGRTRAYLNGRSATVADVREIAVPLLAFYGQHEHRKLTLATAQLEILDGLCGSGHAERLHACAEAFARVRKIERDLAELAELSAQRERELDLLEFELGEIDALAPREGEHEQLLALRERLRHRDALQAAAGRAAEALAPDADGDAGTVRALAAAVAELDVVAGLDPALDDLAERVRGVALESEDLARELRGHVERAGAPEQDVALAAFADRGEVSLDAVEERMSALERLMRKHGASVAAVLEFAEDARARRELLAGAEEATADAEARLAQARADFGEQLAVLRRARERAASGFAAAVREQLAALAMADATFEVALGEREPGPAGGDSVEFMIAPNPGVPAGPLREIASGGELSRVMLAIMSVANSSAAAAGTLVFDEVDAGVGGQTARAVGARLRELADHRQVICITHLPQIASLAERHFSIAKDTSAEPTLTTVVELAESDVLGELVRMLGADEDDGAARRHARELRRAA